MTFNYELKKFGTKKFIKKLMARKYIFEFMLLSLFQYKQIFSCGINIKGFKINEIFYLYALHKDRERNTKKYGVRNK